MNNKLNKDLKKLWLRDIVMVTAIDIIMDAVMVMDIETYGHIHGYGDG